eukprot:TRINITY_DN65224_c0_g1_i1.p1 TRINITY_DN65224_c0_g1~~TRINITY_DN65224_c0_g1_i1.p1  ORF type:complete len:1519 (+),score=374.86 TRINITY_DN65224_c0_g1_i1:69-4625(+)
MATAVAPTQDASFFVRRADPDDIDTINAMFERTYEDFVAAEAFAHFHATNATAMKEPLGRQKFFVSMIETCFMSVTVEDEENNIAGFALLDDTPLQISALEGAGSDWETWFQDTYAMPEVDNTNSLWLCCCLAEAEPAIMAEILRTTFSTMHELQHLLVFVPAGLTEDSAVLLLAPFETHFHQLVPATDELAPMGHWAAASADGTPPIVLRCSREQVILPLGIRIARVEDHDNLAAVFDAQSEVVTSVYGDFFIAELIEAQNEENRALVAEVDGRAVGLMCFTSDVDINVLAQCFQLDAYDNLLKPHYMRRVRDHANTVLAGNGDASLCSQGDFMQVALGSMDMMALLDSIPQSTEDGRVSAVQLHGALQMQEFADEVGEALQDFEKGMMMLIWQMNFLEPMLEGNSLIHPDKVADCVSSFMTLDINERKNIAQQVLDRWSEVEEILKLTKEVIAPEDAEEEKKAEDEGEQGEAALEISTEPSAVETVVFLKALSLEEQGLFPQDFLAKLAATLHWWTDADVSSPLSVVPEDGYKAALEQILESEEGLFVSHPHSPAWLANMPQHSKDVFCINICCLDQAYQTQALDFLLPAFSLYPEKDYCIITQPHTAPNTPLLNAFTIVPPKPQNTFGHVLYLIHRAALLGPPKVSYLKPHLMEQLPSLVEVYPGKTQEEIVAGCKLFLRQGRGGDSVVFVAEFDEQVVGLIMLEMPSPDVVDRLRCCYHLDDYLLVEHHQGGNKGHARLLHWVINPLFQKYTRRLLQGAMRICGKTVLCVESDLKDTVSPIFRELLQVAPRRPPQLKKILRTPPKVATFAGVPVEVPTEEDIRDEERQRLLRDGEQTKALSIVAKKLLSEMKIPVNARIVVVGASDCGLSFLESLLAIPHLVFNSLTLLAPGGLEYHHSHHLPLVAGTAAYSHQELRRIMLELRVRILDSRMVQIDRQQKCCILHDRSMLPYDYLIVATGLQDDALHSLKIRSWGVEHVTDGYRRVNGAMSAADPSIRDLLIEGGTLVKSLIWNPLSYAVVYGRSLHAYCVVQGLLLRKVPPKKIILVLPPRLQESSKQGLSVDAFYEGDAVEEKIHHILATMGLKVYEGYKLLDIQQDTRHRLKSLVLEDHSGAEPAPPPPETSEKDKDKEAKTPRTETAKAPMGTMEEFGATDAGLPQKLLACRICITADAVNVDPDIFNSVHGNGLVYDGRLIVDHTFKTTDSGIFGAGSLCEFSRRFHRKNAARYLKHDGFNGREVGAKLASALLRMLDPVNGDMLAAGGNLKSGAGGAAGSMQDPSSPGGMQSAEGGIDAEESSPDLLPEFYMPIAKGGLLPGNLHYYRIHSCRRGDLQAEQAEKKVEEAIVTDTLDTTNGTGHFCRLTLDSFGKVDSITYLGGEELQVESLWSLVGLSETFLNHLYVRWKSDDIPDIVEFLTDEWATALFHDRFMDFCHAIKLEMLSQDEVRRIINTALDSVNPKEGLSRKLLAQIRQQLPEESVKAMQDHLLEYLQENQNHLKTYFLPWQWDPSSQK